MINNEYEHGLETLFVEMNTVLFSYAKIHLHSEDLAQEAVQETFLIACKKAETLFACPNPKGWIMRTLQNVIMRIRDQNKKATLLLVRLALFSNDMVLNSATNDIDFEETYAKLLDPNDFKLIKAIVIENHSMRYVASNLGISTEACKKRYQRAMKKLISQYRKHFPE